MVRVKFFLLGLLLIVPGATVITIAQAPADTPKRSGGEVTRLREDSITVLRRIRTTLNEHYFDKSLRGIDIDAKVKAAEDRIKTLSYNWEMYRVMAQFLLDFDDSHTSFVLPPRSDFLTYGFDLQMIGEECLVTSVTPESDAAKKGLQVGDRIDSIGKFTPSRRDLWKIMYVLYRLNPYKELGLKISKPDGTQKTLLIEGATRSRKEYRQAVRRRREAGELKPFVCKPLNTEIIACKLRSFSVDRPEISRMMGIASKYRKLILDLRGNGGGYVDTELFLVGAFFDKDVPVANVVTRKKTSLRTADGWRRDAFKGELAVIIDSDSASAAEVFARVIQIEKRGKIFGDVSSGSVMTSIYVPISSITDAFATVYGGQFGMSVTVADVVMGDGKRLEKLGVIPDIPVIPTQQALAKGLDPVLALAATTVGYPMTPEVAGELHFIKDRSQTKVEDESDEGTEP